MTEIARAASQSTDRAQERGEAQAASFGRSQRIELQVADAVQQARLEVGKHKNTLVRGHKTQGRTGELLAHEARPNSVDVNQVLRNHPVYDLYDSQHAYSVKTRHNRPDGSAPVGNYAHDLRVAIGALPPSERGRYAGLQGVDIAAERLSACKSESPDQWRVLSKGLPSEIVRSDDAAQIARSLRDGAQLLVPADHVLPTRVYVQRVAQLHPGKYGLPQNLTDKDLATAARALAARVQPIARSVDSEIIATYVAKAVRPRARRL